MLSKFAQVKEIGFQIKQYLRQHIHFHFLTILNISIANQTKIQYNNYHPAMYLIRQYLHLGLSKIAAMVRPKKTL